MVSKTKLAGFLVALALAESAGALWASSGSLESGADRILEGISQPGLARLVAEVLERNPEIALLRSRAEAAVQRGPQARALPDPTLTLTAFVRSPETRTGPQRLSAGVSQALPWRGKLALAEEALSSEARALEAKVESRRIELVTETRRLVYELGYLDRRRVIGEELLDHLTQHEEIARARYSTGAGRGQGVIKLQAEITLAEDELLSVRRRRIVLESRLNELRDRPALAPIAVEGLPEARRVILDLESLTERALDRRPELASAEARTNGARSRVELAQTGGKPDFRLGLVYTLVEPRDDGAARLLPPEGNGNDIVGIQGGITLPVRRKSLDAALEEALSLQSAAEASHRAARAEIAAAVADLAQRVELDWRRLRLLEDLLIVQAEESEESALAGYIAGTVEAIELLDAEHVLFEARIARARAQTDYLIQIAELEGAVAAPIGLATGGHSR